ncbi:hypothetical protein DFQ30_008539 [Apophysomyces sp. BC1015]|nr:hypothetical protein DFQ30_008539 [Apophysomyces sp. BC1015]
MFSVLLLSSIFFRFLARQLPRKHDNLHDLIQLGKELYDTHSYDEAYRLFAGLEELTDDTAICVVYQIRCLQHLDQWQLALAQCRRMIRHNPECALWYLLASDIYLSQKMYRVAWETVQGGIVASFPSGDYYEELCHHQRITLELVYQKPNETRLDMADVLPYDLVCAVFLKLPLDSLVRCTRVSRRWSDYIVQSPHLWHELEFLQSQPIHMSTLNIYLSRLKGTPLMRLTVHRGCTSGDDIIMALMHRECYQLQALDLSEVVCTPKLFFRLLEAVGPTLKSLTWTGVTLKFNDIVEHVAQTCKKLKHLDLENCLATKDHPLAEQPSLQHLEYFGQTLSPQCVQILASLSGLPIESLSLNSIHGLNTRSLAGELEELDISGIPAVSDNVLEAVVKCSRLQQLRISRCKHVTNAGIIFLVEALKDISAATQSNIDIDCINKD